MLALLVNVPAHDCGRGCDICAEYIGAAALGVTPAYSATLAALATASDRLRAAPTVGDAIAAREDVKRLRKVAADLMPLSQRVEVPSC
jgi:hypothetical protein